jgi:hypothetical protein
MFGFLRDWPGIGSDQRMPQTHAEMAQTTRRPAARRGLWQSGFGVEWPSGLPTTLRSGDALLLDIAEHNSLLQDIA